MIDWGVGCVTGDGGFLMMAGEVVTAKRLGLNVVFLVLADRELSLIRIKQDEKGVENYGVELYEGDLIDEGTFLGVPVKKVENSQELGAALSESLGSDGPVIIEAVINGKGYNGLITGEFR